MKRNATCTSILKRLHLVFILTVALASLLQASLASGQISPFVQVNTTPFKFIYTNSASVPFTAPETAGDLNIVVVGLGDISSTIASVTDSNGNTYTLAAGTVATPLSTQNVVRLGVSQTIYYARNINAGANTVTVTFNQNTNVQSIRILEYSGLDTANPLDNSVGGIGNTSPADSGAVAINSANDLIFGAGTITTVFAGGGAGFMTELLNSFGDIVEDKFVTAAGSYNATATPTTGGWVMQAVAFRASGQTPPTFSAPSITSLSTPSSAEVGAIPVTITGTNFEPGATVVFSNGGGVSASGVNCSVTSNTTIDCLTPSFPTGPASITVTNVDGQASAPFSFSFTPSTPFVTAVSPSITPATGTTNGGTLVRISGSDFAAGATVMVGGVPADQVTVLNSSTIDATLPAGSAGAASVVVTNPSSTSGALTGGYTYATTAGISFVQANAAQPTSPATTAPVGYNLAQTAGNFNVVIIGWADATATVQSVTDSALNSYTPALNTVGTGLTQAIYYAKNIHAAGSNIVTVTFNVAAQSPDVRVFEYSGLDTASPLDAFGGSAGTGVALDSGPITTTKANDLIIGAGKTSGGAVSTGGQGFITTSLTPDGDNTVHLIGSPLNPVDAIATQNASTPWVMQAVAFLEASIPDFAIAIAAPTTVSVTPGHSATYTVSVTGQGGYVTPVVLTCSAGLPAGATCSFAPPSVTPGALPVTSMVTINTSPSTPVTVANVTVTGTAGLLSHTTLLGLNVNAPADFGIAATALSPASVSPGANGTSTIAITPANGFTATVNLTCTVAPSGTRSPTCSFNPASVSGGSGTSTLTVSTTAATTASFRRQSGSLFAMMWLPVGGLALLGAGFTSRKKKVCAWVLGFLMFSGLIFLAACGGGSSSGGGGTSQPGTASGTYTITVTGTSGSLTHSPTTTLSLVVQ